MTLLISFEISVRVFWGKGGSCIYCPIPIDPYFSDFLQTPTLTLEGSFGKVKCRIIRSLFDMKITCWQKNFKR